MPTRVRLSALLALALGVTVQACAGGDSTRADKALDEGPGMIYVSLSDSASGNPVPRSSLQLLPAADADMTARTPTRMSASDSASGNPAPRTLLVSCTDAAGNPVPCQWSTTP